MKKIIIRGQLVGTYQQDNNFFARFVPFDKKEEIDLPISKQEFHGLIFRDATLTLEVV